jgi:hypothetical protein
MNFSALLIGGMELPLSILHIATYILVTLLIVYSIIVIKASVGRYSLYMSDLKRGPIRIQFEHPRTIVEHVEILGLSLNEWLIRTICYLMLRMKGCSLPFLYLGVSNAQRSGDNETRVISHRLAKRVMNCNVRMAEVRMLRTQDVSRIYYDDYVIQDLMQHFRHDLVPTRETIHSYIVRMSTLNLMAPYAGDVVSGCIIGFERECMLRRMQNFRLCPLIGQ